MPIKDRLAVSPSAALQELKRTVADRRRRYKDMVAAGSIPAAVAVQRIARLQQAVFILEAAQDKCPVRIQEVTL
jgi:hypothetical protein